MSHKTFHILAALLLLCGVMSLAGCSTTTTAVYVLRHAEKAAGTDPSLTQTGQQRARELVRVLKNVPLAGVYSTDYNRTRQTAQPLADDKNLQLNIYNNTSIAGTILSRHERDNALVVGHSDTVPQLIQAFGGTAPYEAIPGTQFDNLFLIIVKQEHRSGSNIIRRTKVLHMKYGAASP